VPHKQHTNSSRGLFLLLIDRKIRLCGKNTPCEPICFALCCFVSSMNVHYTFIMDNVHLLVFIFMFIKYLSYLLVSKFF